MKSLVQTAFLLASLTLSSHVSAKRLLIVHTNDLHSYFAGNRQGGGGYAKLKTRIEQIRTEAQQQNLDVLQLDGGDFGEGTSFFLSDEGATSLKALGMLGAEVSVIGNHDHMMGGDILSQQISRANVNTKFLSANLIQTPDMNLGDLVKPTVDIQKAGINIRIIGLSTSEVHFQYPLFPGFIVPPVPVGAELAELARKDNKELIIALTHIGKSEDIKLAQKSREIDLIVGGHSHTFIKEVVYEKNKNGKQIPIVQAGAHGLVVGTLLIDVKGVGDVEVLDYKLHEIAPPLEEDVLMSTLVAQAAQDRNDYFGGRWNEVIGQSTIPLTGYANGKNDLVAGCWGDHMAKMTWESTGADLGVYLASFAGERIEAGAITFGDMVDNFPHFRGYGDNGWEMSTISVNGKTFKTLLTAFANLGDNFGATFYGPSYKSITLPSFIPYVGGRKILSKIRVNGEKIKSKQLYSIAFPSEIAYAIKETLPEKVRKLIPPLNPTGKFYWAVAEEYIRENSPIGCLK